MKPLCYGKFPCRKRFNNKFDFFNLHRIFNCSICFMSILVSFISLQYHQLCLNFQI